MLIAFIHNDKSFLPEIAAYQRYFSGYNITCISRKRNEHTKMDRQVDWFFMGSDLTPREPGVYKIHEYLSASTPPGGWWKDRLKRYLNARPDYRLYLNSFVKERLSFRDHVPYGFRDMGLWLEHYENSAVAVEKKFDFIHTGTISKDMGFERLLDHFTAGAPLANHSLLVVSKHYEALQEGYKASRNILFTGPVDQPGVRELIAQARFAINYKPDVIPYNRQTSTKLLEYGACHIPIITTHAQWIHDFQRQYGGNYFFLEPDLSNFTWEKVNAFKYGYPDLSAWGWEEQIKKSGVIAFLQSKFPEAFSGTGSRQS